MKINNPDNLPQEYINAEIEQVEKETRCKVEVATFERIDENNCRQNFKFKKVPFERIRRITGYLVGTTDRWGDAKKAELADRVKHGGDCKR